MLEGFFSSRLGIAAFLITIPQFLLIIFPIVMVLLGCILRRWTLCTINFALTAFAFFALLNPSWGRSNEKNKPDIKIMTYNVMLGNLGIEGVINMIAEEDPDVVCLQEANVHRSDLYLPYRLTVRLPGYNVVHQGDIIIASKHPIRLKQKVILPEAGLQRPCLFAEISIGYRTVVVGNMHLVHARYDRISQNWLRAPQISLAANQLRERQGKQILDAAQSLTGPVVVCGDMNQQPKGELYRAFRSHLIDTWDATQRGLGYSFHSAFPYARIDYIWSSQDLEPIRSHVIESHYSDHMPLVTELSWKRG